LSERGGERRGVVRELEEEARSSWIGLMSICWIDLGVLITLEKLEKDNKKQIEQKKRKRKRER